MNDPVLRHGANVYLTVWRKHRVVNLVRIEVRGLAILGVLAEGKQWCSSNGGHLKGHLLRSDELHIRERKCKLRVPACDLVQG